MVLYDPMLSTGVFMVVLNTLHKVKWRFVEEKHAIVAGIWQAIWIWISTVFGSFFGESFRAWSGASRQSGPADSPLGLCALRSHVPEWSHYLSGAISFQTWTKHVHSAGLYRVIQAPLVVWLTFIGALCATMPSIIPFFDVVHWSITRRFHYRN